MSRMNDPKWTAFVLGELEGPERDDIRNLIDRNPTVIESVEQIREISALIKESLEEFSPLELTAEQRQSILTATPAREVTPLDKPSGLRRYWIAAAASVALVIAGLATLKMEISETPSSVGESAVAKSAPGTERLSQNAQIDSKTGTGAPQGAMRQIMMFDRAGKLIQEIARPGFYSAFHLSPDGKRLAVEQTRDSGSPEVWLLDIEKAVSTRLTFSGGSSPVWSPDAAVIAFRDPSNGRVYRINSDGSGQRLALLDTPPQSVLLDWSANGTLAFQQPRDRTGSDLWLISVAGGLLFRLTRGPFDSQGAQFSPDGRWIVYASNESGRQEIFAMPFSATGGNWQVSTRGGISPRWRRDGREIFYIAPGGQLMSVEISIERDVFMAGPPRLLFQVPALEATQFEVMPDGQRFILLGEAR